MLSERAQWKKTIIQYTILFAIGLFAAFLPVFAAGKTIMAMEDCISAHFEMFAVRKRIWAEFWNNLFHNHRIAIPAVTWNLSLDDNLLSILGIELTDILFLMTKQDQWEICFVLAQAIKLWAAGMAFIQYYGYRRKQAHAPETVLSALVFVFSGYGIVSSYKWPVFTALLFWLPLVLLGVEVCVREQKYGLLIAAVCGSAVCGLYTHYYLTIVLVPYCIVRLIREKPAALIRNGLRIAVGYLIGFGVSMFLNFHIVYSLLTSGKAESSWRNLGLSYGWPYIQYVSSRFFVYSSYKYTTYLGLSTLGLSVILYLFLKRGHWIQKIAIIAATVLLYIPLWGSIAGMTTTNNRWSFCIPFICAYVMGSVLPELLCETKISAWFIISAGSAAWIAYLTITAKGDTAIYAEAAGLLMALTVIILARLLNNKKAKWVVLLAGFMVTLNLQMWFSPDTDGLAELGTVNQYLASFIDSETKTISDSGFFRIDRSNNEEFFSEMNCNLPFWYGFNGISSYRNALNDSVTAYLRESGNIGFLHNAKVAGMDGKTTDEILACTKYYLRDENAVVPYGFSQVDPAVWRNENTLPLGYTYEQAVTLADYKACNVAEQQELMLKAVVIEEAVSNGYPELSSRELDTEIVTMKGVKQNGGGFSVVKKDAEITLRTQVPENCELFLELDGIEGAGKITFYVSMGDVQKGSWWYGEGTNYSTRQTRQVFNLGTDAAGVKKIVISSPKRGYTIQAIRCYARDLNGVDNDVKQLSAFALENISVATNRISGTIDLPSEQWLVFSLPYSKGWHCFVDGEERALKKTNIMYMGLLLESGHHDIILKYFPYGMKAGIAVSLFCVVIWFAISLAGRQRKIECGCEEGQVIKKDKRMSKTE